MKRRKFLGLLGLTTAAAAAPAAAAAAAAAPAAAAAAAAAPAAAPAAAATSTATKTTGSPAESHQQPAPHMPITPSMQHDIDTCARYQTKAMNGDPIDQERTDRALSKIKSLHEHIEELKAEKDNCKTRENRLADSVLGPHPRLGVRYLPAIKADIGDLTLDAQFRVNNRQEWCDEIIAIDHLHIANCEATISKDTNAKHWQDMADHKAKAIENDAQALGYNTEWPGLYPEFTPIPETWAKEKEWLVGPPPQGPPVDPKDTVFAGFIIEELSVETVSLSKLVPHSWKGTGKYWLATNKAQNLLSTNGSYGFWVTDPQHATQYPAPELAIRAAGELIEKTQIIPSKDTPKQTTPTEQLALRINGKWKAATPAEQD